MAPVTLEWWKFVVMMGLSGVGVATIIHWIQEAVRGRF